MSFLEGQTKREDINPGDSTFDNMQNNQNISNSHKISPSSLFSTIEPITLCYDDLTKQYFLDNFPNVCKVRGNFDMPVLMQNYQLLPDQEFIENSLTKKVIKLSEIVKSFPTEFPFQQRLFREIVDRDLRELMIFWSKDEINILYLLRADSYFTRFGFYLYVTIKHNNRLSEKDAINLFPIGVVGAAHELNNLMIKQRWPFHYYGNLVIFKRKDFSYFFHNYVYDKIYFHVENFYWKERLTLADVMPTENSRKLFVELLQNHQLKKLDVYRAKIENNEMRKELRKMKNIVDLEANDETERFSGTYVYFGENLNRELFEKYWEEVSSL